MGLTRKKRRRPQRSTLASGQGVRFDVELEADEPRPERSRFAAYQAAIGKKGS